MGRDGNNLDYFWYRAVRASDGVSFRFGSRDGSHEPEKDYELNIVKEETERGTFMYKELTGMGANFAAD